MNLGTWLRLDVRRLAARARRGVVGALGWILIAVGAAAIVTPVPFAIPVLFAGAALLEETNPGASRAILGVAAAARRELMRFGGIARRTLRGMASVPLVLRLAPATHR